MYWEGLHKPAKKTSAKHYLSILKARPPDAPEAPQTHRPGWQYQRKAKGLAGRHVAAGAGYLGPGGGHHPAGAVSTAPGIKETAGSTPPGIRTASFGVMEKM